MILVYECDCVILIHIVPQRQTDAAQCVRHIHRSMDGDATVPELSCTTWQSLNKIISINNIMHLET